MDNRLSQSTNPQYPFSGGLAREVNEQTINININENIRLFIFIFFIFIHHKDSKVFVTPTMKV